MNYLRFFLFLCVLVLLMQVADARSKRNAKKKPSFDSIESDSKAASGSAEESGEKHKEGHKKGHDGDKHHGQKEHKGKDKSSGEDEDKSKEKSGSGEDEDKPKEQEGSDENHGMDPDDPAMPDIPKDIKAGRILERNFLAVLYALANSTADNFINLTVAAHTLLRDINEENFSLMDAFAFVPEFLTTDVPTQFLQLLTLVKDTLSKGDFRLQTAFNVLMEWVEGLMEDTAQAQMKMSPFIMYWSGIFGAFKKFYRQALQDIFDEIEH